MPWTAGIEAELCKFEAKVGCERCWLDGAWLIIGCVAGFCEGWPVDGPSDCWRGWSDDLEARGLVHMIDATVAVLTSVEDWIEAGCVEDT